MQNFRLSNLSNATLIEDYSYWAALCDSLLKAQKPEEALTACDQAIALNLNTHETWTA